MNPQNINIIDMKEARLDREDLKHLGVSIVDCVNKTLAFDVKQAERVSFICDCLEAMDMGRKPFSRFKTLFYKDAVLELQIKALAVFLAEEDLTPVFETGYRLFNEDQATLEEIKQIFTTFSRDTEWKDPVGFRDEMRNKRYQTRSNHRDGSLSTFFIPKEKPPFIKKEFQTWRKDACTGYLSSPFNIYGLGSLDSRKRVNNNRRKSHHVSKLRPQSTQ